MPTKFMVGCCVCVEPCGVVVQMWLFVLLMLFLLLLLLLFVVVVMVLFMVNYCGLGWLWPVALWLLCGCLGCYCYGECVVVDVVDVVVVLCDVLVMRVALQREMVVL